MKTIGTLILVAAIACGAAAAQPAFAKPVVRSRMDTVAAAALDGAQVRVRLQAKSRDRADLRIEVRRAASGLSLEAWVADADGTMTRAGALIEDDGTPGEYRLRIRTDKGGTLPGGAANAADLAGRVVEVRDAAGNVVATGAMPGVTPPAGGGTGAKRGGADDPAAHDANDDRGGARGGRGRGRGADDPANHG